MKATMKTKHKQNTKQKFKKTYEILLFFSCYEKSVNISQSVNSTHINIHTAINTIAN